MEKDQVFELLGLVYQSDLAALLQKREKVSRQMREILAGLMLFSIRFLQEILIQ